MKNKYLYSALIIALFSAALVPPAGGRASATVGCLPAFPIVFDSSGTIFLQSGLNINRPNLMIAGRTAHGGGITAAGWATRITGQTASSAAPIKWEESLRQQPQWYASDEAVRIADNLLLYQRDTGGWHKNIEMAAALGEKEKADLVREKRKTDSTIDNGATYTQLAYLARVYSAKRLDRHKQAFLKGVDYLLGAQYGNGGWPQYHPDLTGYRKHITFNDGAMIGVMKLLRDIAARKPAYAFVDEDRRRKAEEAVERGVECILKTQVVVRGKRTVWCAQHDAVTLAPAGARKYEVASLSGGESVGIVRFLMDINRPGGRVVEAIESAIAWFKESTITGLRWVERPDPSKPGGFNRMAVPDPEAGPLWARFYEIETNRPIFVGRDGRIKYSVAEIEDERRNAYQWYTATPARLLGEDYPAWRKKRAAGEDRVKG